MDASGDLFIPTDNVVREVDHSSGLITTVAGNGISGFSGDGKAATDAELDGPDAVAVDAAGDLFIASGWDNRIREVDHSTGVITTIAGNGARDYSGNNGYSGNGGVATNAELGCADGIAVDAAGDLFIADSGNNVIREVNHSTDVITTTAGDGTAGYSGDGGSPTSSQLQYPGGVAVDAVGDLFIADSGNNVIREVPVPQTLVLDGPTTIDVPSGQTLVLSGVSGDGSIIKTGLGTLTLDGANTYIGDTTLTAGTLDVEGSITSTVVIVGGQLTGPGAFPSMSLSASTPVSQSGPVTLTATLVATASTSQAPGGTVEFYDGTTILGAASLGGSSAQFTIATLTAGQHTFTAVYSGDATFVGNTAATVNALPWA